MGVLLLSVCTLIWTRGSSGWGTLYPANKTYGSCRSCLRTSRQGREAYGQRWEMTQTRRCDDTHDRNMLASVWSSLLIVIVAALGILVSSSTVSFCSPSPSTYSSNLFGAFILSN